MPNPTTKGIDSFVFDAVGYGKPPVLALDPVQSRVGLNEFYKHASPTTVRIRDSEQLLKERDKIDKAIKYVKPAKKMAGYASAVLEAIKVSQEGLSVGLQNLLNMQSPSATSAGLPSVYLIEEDALKPNEFAEFVSRFQQINDEKKPRIVMVANDTLDGALKLVSACGENVAAHVLSTEGLKEVATLDLTCGDFGEFVDLFLNEGDGYCASTDLAGMFPGQSGEDVFNRSLALMLQIQSLFRCGRKFDAVNSVLLLADQIERLRAMQLTDTQQNKVLGFRAICNLWTSYLTEAHPEKIENSLSIAEHLKDPLLKAHALKLIAIVSGRSSLTHQMLEQAKAIFEARGELEQALFVETNILDNNIFSERIDVERAIRLSAYTEEVAPYVRRSTTIHSNAAIALLLAGRVTRAREVFDLALSGSGPPVNLLTSEINALIAEYVDGEVIEEDRVHQLIHKILRSGIDANFNYHQAVMFGNLWKMCADNEGISTRIRTILREKNFLDYGRYLDDPNAFVRYAATRTYDLTATEPSLQPGIAGLFIEKHGLMPASHVFYR